MMNTEMITRCEEAGARRWTKGNHDRLYFNINTLVELGREYEIDFDPSRQIRNFGKVYFDVKSGELKMENLTQWNREDVTAILTAAGCIA